MTDMDSIETNLKSICRQKGLTLTDVANRIGTSPSNLLSSVKGNPTISKIQDIADALNISVSELLTRRPEKAQGIAIIDGQAFQISKPTSSIVQLPTYDRYDTLRSEIKEFVKKAIEGEHNISKMGLVETMEVFSLTYDKYQDRFVLALCYADGKTMTIIYDKLEYCDWGKNLSEREAFWNQNDVTQEIINDIEGAVSMRLLCHNNRA